MHQSSRVRFQYLQTVLRYTPYDGLSLANQKNRMLWVFGPKLDESHPIFQGYVAIYQKTQTSNIEILSFSSNQTNKVVELLPHYLEIIDQEATLTTTMVKLAWAI